MGILYRASQNYTLASVAICYKAEKALSCLPGKCFFCFIFFLLELFKRAAVCHVQLSTLFFNSYKVQVQGKIIINGFIAQVVKKAV